MIMTPAQARKWIKKNNGQIHHEMISEKRIYGFYTSLPFTRIGMADYQRGVSGQHVAKIKGEFMLDSCQALMVSLRPIANSELVLWCFDGQHRIEAMSELDYTQHYCHVVLNLTYEEEARRFFILNDVQRQMAGWVKFKAAYNARNPIHRKLVRECDARGLTNPITHNVSAKGGDIASPNYLLWPFQKGGMSLVRAVLDVLDQCWREGGKKTGVVNDAKDAALIRGLATFLKHHYFGGAELPWSAIRQILRRVTPSFIREEAKKRPAIRTDMKQYHEAICQVFGVDMQRRSPSCHLRRVA